MLKKIGLASLALGGLLAFATPKADAAVRFGIGVGVTPAVPVAPAVPVYPAAPPYVDPYAYPNGYAYDYANPAYVPYAYPYVAPSVGFGFGFGGHHEAPVYRGHFGHEGGFHDRGRR